MGSQKKRRFSSREKKIRPAPAKLVDKCWMCGQLSYFAANCALRRCLHCGKPGHEKRRCHSWEIKIRPASAKLVNKKWVCAGWLFLSQLSPKKVLVLWEVRL